MATLLPNVRLQFLDGNGAPLAAGQLFSYAAGTSTPLATFTDESEATNNPNPTILDANGTASVWIGAEGYKFTLKDSLNNVLWTVDDVYNITPGSVSTAALADGAVTTVKIADGALSADSSGRALMADGFLTTAKIADLAVTTAKIADNAVGLTELAANVSSALVPTGGIIPFGGTAAPTGFLLCDGTSYLIATYSGLAAALLDSSTSKYAYGSADSTHFNVPDFRGFFLRGADNGAGVDPDASARLVMNTGGNSGNAIGSTQADQIRAHVHSDPGAVNPGNVSQSGTQTSAFGTAGNVGSSGGNETRPLNAYVNYLIKT